ncbi:MAG: ATP-binding cassette domain-containing protein, partial [Nitrosopumilaceae archaeon]
MEEILSVQNLTKHFVKKGMFSSSGTVVKAADNISFSLKKGEVLVLAGESGSGKSTAARLILRAIEPDSGRIFFDGTEIGNDNKNIEKIRMQCQMIHQDPYASIDPRMRISDIIMEPLEIHKV